VGVVLVMDLIVCGFEGVCGEWLFIIDYVDEYWYYCV